MLYPYQIYYIITAVETEAVDRENAGGPRTAPCTSLCTNSSRGGGCVKSAKKILRVPYAYLTRIFCKSNANPTRFLRKSNANPTQIQRTSNAHPTRFLRKSNAHPNAHPTHIHQPREIPTYISSRWLCTPLRTPDWWRHVRVSAVHVWVVLGGVGRGGTLGTSTTDS